ncbi:MAG: hypothetical protein EXQ70_08005 [Solirubrobacterales bacterium]|nr:hypothetical protein [Solirubrobacterales bacterium]
MARFAIRVPTVDDLLDPYSVEPLASRPMTDDVRERILDAWIDTRGERPARLTVEIPSDQRREGLAPQLEKAIRNDLEETRDDSRELKIYTRSELRHAQIAFVFLIICQLGSTLMSNDGAVLRSVSQGLVVLGWVAMWGPADKFFRGISRRLSYRRYKELADVPIEVSWAD